MPKKSKKENTDQKRLESLEKEINDCFSISESGPAQLRNSILKKVV